jgi:hypothetical protein
MTAWARDVRCGADHRPVRALQRPPRQPPLPARVVGTALRERWRSNWAFCSRLASLVASVLRFVPRGGPLVLPAAGAAQLGVRLDLADGRAEEGPSPRRTRTGRRRRRAPSPRRWTGLPACRFPGRHEVVDRPVLGCAGHLATSAQGPSCHPALMNRGIAHGRSVFVAFAAVTGRRGP